MLADQNLALRGIPRQVVGLNLMKEKYCFIYLGIQAKWFY